MPHVFSMSGVANRSPLAKHPTLGDARLVESGPQTPGIETLCHCPLFMASSTPTHFGSGQASHLPKEATGMVIKGHLEHSLGHKSLWAVVHV